MKKLEDLTIEDLMSEIFTTYNVKNSFLGTQIRYILVARCMRNGEESNIFFTFTNNDIQRFLFNGVIPQPAAGNANLSIKIDYDPRTGKAYLCDGKYRDDISFCMNNFNL